MQKGGEIRMKSKSTLIALAAAVLVSLLVAVAARASYPDWGPTPQVTAQIAVPAATPRLPVAGSEFTVVHAVTRSDGGGLLTAGKMVCDPSIAGNALTHAESFTGGLATLHFTVPAGSQGKLLKVHVTIRLGDRTATRDSYFRILAAPAPWSYKPLP
jgi:hypothetical protein